MNKDIPNNVLGQLIPDTVGKGLIWVGVLSLFFLYFSNHFYLRYIAGSGSIILLGAYLWNDEQYTKLWLKHAYTMEGNVIAERQRNSSNALVFFFAASLCLLVILNLNFIKNLFS